QWLAVYKAGNDNVVNRRLAVGAASKEMEDADSQILMDMALKDDWHSVRQLALEYISRMKPDKWKDKWKDEVLRIAKNDRDNIVRATAFELLGQWKVNEAKPGMLAALNDSSYAVAGA